MTPRGPVAPPTTKPVLIHFARSFPFERTLCGKLRRTPCPVTTAARYTTCPACKARLEADSTTLTRHAPTRENPGRGDERETQVRDYGSAARKKRREHGLWLPHADCALRDRGRNRVLLGASLRTVCQPARSSAEEE